jgi:hypothetical protein
MDESPSVKLSCSTHSRALELICHTCNHAICFDCVVSSCRSHRFDKTQDAVVDAMEGAKQTSTQLTRKAGMINEALANTDRVFNGELALRSVMTNECRPSNCTLYYFAFFFDHSKHISKPMRPC